MRFTINGEMFDLTREGVESELSGIAPEQVTVYSVVIDGRSYPVKQVLARVTDLSRSSFDSGRAQHILREIGFDIVGGPRSSPRRIPGTTRYFGGVPWGLTAAPGAGFDRARSGKLHRPGCAHGVVHAADVWSEARALDAWEAAPDVPLDEQTDPGWCTDCAAIQGIVDPGDPADPASNGSPTGRAERAAMAEAARVVLEPGLRGAPSVLDGVTVTWTGSTAQALREAMAVPGEEGSFVERLRRQLQDKPREVILLAAELCFLERLALVNILPATKLARVQAILSLLAPPAPVPDVMDDALHVQGLFNGGQGFSQSSPQHLQWLCSFIEHWTGLTQPDRDAAMDDPWTFRSRLMEVPQPAIPIVNSLLVLQWPSIFEAIVNSDHKKSIRNAFVGVLANPSEDVDRDLLRIRETIDPEGTLDIDWYTGPWSLEWRSPKPEVKRRGWSVPSAVEGEPLSPPNGLSASSRGQTRPEVRTAALQQWNRTRPIMEVLADVDVTVEYLQTMHDDDQILVDTGDHIGIGVIGALSQDLTREVEWLTSLGSAELSDGLRDRLQHASYLAEVPTVDLPAMVIERAGPERLKLLPATPALAGRLHYDEAWLTETLALLEERRQMILFGPPGTGKTFLARALAEFVAAKGDIRIVQFHPSYSYEDFFEGFRPSYEGGAASFTLTPGPLRLIAGAAAANPTKPYVLIIDEINRANIAKVFGELYLLLEYRDAPISLQYSPSTEFRLPENLFIIGTMNTADRSISLVDAAIRRRFSFVELHPAEAPVRGLLDRWSTARSEEVGRGHLLRALNERIGDIDRDFQIGPSYLMGPGARTDAGLRRIWDHDILPLLDEQYYGRLTRQEVRARFGLDALEPIHDDGSLAESDLQAG